MPSQRKLQPHTYETIHELWVKGVVDGPSGNRTPALKTYYEKDSPVRWERRLTTKDGTNNRVSATRFKAIAWYMLREITQHEINGVNGDAAIKAVVASMAAKWGNNKSKAYSAINKLMRAAPAEPGDEDGDEGGE